jgi:Protein kinase domain
MCVYPSHRVWRVLHAYFHAARVNVYADSRARPGFIFRDIEGQSTRHADQIWRKYDVGYEYVFPGCPGIFSLTNTARLGAGAFARVHKCMERATGIEYAVKIINKTKLNCSSVDEQAVIREISILQRLAHFRHVCTFVSNRLSLTFSCRKILSLYTSTLRRKIRFVHLFFLVHLFVFTDSTCC